MSLVPGIACSTHRETFGHYSCFYSFGASRFTKEKNNISDTFLLVADIFHTFLIRYINQLHIHMSLLCFEYRCCGFNQIRSEIECLQPNSSVNFDIYLI